MASLLLTITTLIAYISSPTDAGRSTTTCSDAYECQGKTINSNLVSCNGFGGCDSSSIYSKGLKGYIDCTASHGCNEASSLVAVKNIYCVGYYACFSATEISAKMVECAGSYSCNSSPSITSDTFVYCEGLEACKSSTITADKTIYCDGLNSCNAATITSEDEILCQGNKACIGAKLESMTNVECSGNLACKRSRIKAEKVKLYGSGSGQNTKINAEEIIGSGYNALSESEIDSTNRTTMKVKVSGEAAGSDATVICRDGSDCDVECIDECGGLEVVSFEGATTTISSGGNTCSETATNITGCPTVKISSSDCEDRELETYLAHKREIIAARMVNDMDTDSNYKGFIVGRGHHDAMEEIEAEIMKCDKSGECKNSIIFDNDAQCYGYEGCRGSIINQTSTTGIVACYGESGCNTGFLNSRGDILCNAKDSCKMAIYFEGKSVECGGLESCAYITNIMHVGSIDCEATGSCRDNTILGKTNVKCLANRACFNSDITAGNGIVCDGHYSCSEGNLEAAGPVKCTSLGSCDKSVIRAGKYAYFDGYKSGLNAIIQAPVIRAYGYQSISGSLIDSNYTDKFVVKAYGDLSGFESMVICREGKECKLQCESTGCKNMEFICLNGAICKITPKECQQPRGPKQVGGIHCPIFIESQSIDDDDELLKYIQEKRKINQENDDLYMMTRNKNKNNNINKQLMSDNMDGDDNNNDNKNEWDMIILYGLIIIIAVILICYFKCNYYFKSKQDQYVVLLSQS